MKYIFILLFPCIMLGQVGIGTETPDPSSILDITSDSGGILIPRMTQAERDAITSPATGLLLYQTDGTIGFYYYSGLVWTPFTNSLGQWVVNANDLYNANTGNIGIGTATPSTKLHILSNGVVLTILTQDFETTIAPLTTCETVGWVLQGAQVNGGANAAASNNQGVDSSTSFMEYALTVPAGGATLSFYQAVSSEFNFDDLKFYIDGAQQSEISGIQGYQQQTYSFAPGSYTLRWAYEKDFSDSNNDDRAYVDDITIAGFAPPAFRLKDGNQATGKIMTSDASGNAAWETLTAQSITDFPDIIAFQGMEIPACNTNVLGTTGSFTIPIRGVATVVSWEILARQTTAGAIVNIMGIDVLAAPHRPERLQVRYDFSPALPIDPQGIIFSANNTSSNTDTFSLNYALKSQSSITMNITRTDIYGENTSDCWAGAFFFDVLLTD